MDTGHDTNKSDNSRIPNGSVALEDGECITKTKRN